MVQFRAYSDYWILAKANAVTRLPQVTHCFTYFPMYVPLQPDHILQRASHGVVCLRPPWWKAQEDAVVCLLPEHWGQHVRRCCCKCARVSLGFAVAPFHFRQQQMVATPVAQPPGHSCGLADVAALRIVNAMMPMVPNVQ